MTLIFTLVLNYLTSLKSDFNLEIVQVSELCGHIYMAICGHIYFFPIRPYAGMYVYICLQMTSFEGFRHPYSPLAWIFWISNLCILVRFWAKKSFFFVPIISGIYYFLSRNYTINLRSFSAFYSILRSSINIFWQISLRIFRCFYFSQML